MHIITNYIILNGVKHTLHSFPPSPPKFFGGGNHFTDFHDVSSGQLQYTKCKDHEDAPQIRYCQYQSECENTRLGESVELKWEGKCVG
jgi:hypothetical protein